MHKYHVCSSCDTVRPNVLVVAVVDLKTYELIRSLLASNGIIYWDKLAAGARRLNVGAPFS
jgi:hypothetical protein